MNTSAEPGDVCTAGQNHLLLTSANVSSYTYSPGDTTIVCIFMPVVLVVGVLGNGSFLVVMARIEWMRQVPCNIYLASLAVVDIVFLVVTVGGKLSQYLASPIVADETVFGVPGCVSLYFISEFCLFGSMFLITLVSLERYTAVCRPFTFRGRRGVGNSPRLSVFCRIVSSQVVAGLAAAIIIPDRFVWQETCLTFSPPAQFADFPRSFGRCSSVVDWYFTFTTFLQVVPFFLTLFVNFTFYILIAREFYRQSDQQRGQSREIIKEQMLVRHQITRMLVLNGTVFFVLLLPFQASVIAYVIHNISGTEPLLDPHQLSLTFNIGRCLMYTNSAINPFIYTLTSPAYRRAFIDALRPAERRGGSSPENVTLSNFRRINTQDDGHH